MKPIYTEYKNLTPYNIQWLDGCGATWADGQKFSEYKRTDSVLFGHLPNCFTNWKSYLGGGYDNQYIYCPTGDDFCRGVAERLGIEYVDEGVKKAVEHLASLPTPYKSTTYKVLDSLDDVPFDTRIPMSEWLPPFGERVVFIWGELFYDGELSEISENGVVIYNGKQNQTVNLEGHWMRIV